MKFLPFISPALYLIACCLPALATRESTGKMDIMLGLRTFAIGWSGIFAGITAWYANPFWILGVALGFMRKPTFAIVLGIIAIAISYTTFSILGRELPADEGNVNKFTVIQILPGAYVWMASLIVMPIVAAIQRFKQ